MSHQDDSCQKFHYCRYWQRRQSGHVWAVKDASHHQLFDTEDTTPALEERLFHSALSWSIAVDVATPWKDRYVSSVWTREDGSDRSSPACVIITWSL